MNHVEKTKSICPICQKEIEATLTNRDGKVIISKKCPEHGEFSSTHWQSQEIYQFTEKFDYFRYFEESRSAKNPAGCPKVCESCKSHVSDTVIGVIDVTKKCDLNCAICFSTLGFILSPPFL